MAGEINFELKYPRWICFFASCSLFYVSYTECHCGYWTLSIQWSMPKAKHRRMPLVLMARHWWLSSNKLLKMKYFSRNTSDGNWKRHLIPWIPKEFFSERSFNLYVHGTRRDIPNKRELREKVIKLLREEWLKIDKNIFVRNIRCFPTSIFQYSRRQFANISP